MVIRSHQTEEPAVDLEIALSKVCFIILKGREFEAKEEASENGSGSNPVDDAELEVLEDRDDDPVVEEITSLIDELTVDEQVDLVALNWLGREEDNSAADWPDQSDMKSPDAVPSVAARSGARAPPASGKAGARWRRSERGYRALR